MTTPNRRPWRFVLLTALILLAGGMAVGMAARLVVVPQAQRTVEVDTPTIPSVLGQSVDEVVFYPWDRYDPEAVSTSFSPDSENQNQWFYQENLVRMGGLLGLSGLEDSMSQGAFLDNLWFWCDCPATTQAGQPALLDVALGQDSGNFGMTWVARSTGEPPTRAQKEAAVAKVQEDVCGLFDDTEEKWELKELLYQLEEYVYSFGSVDEELGIWENSVGSYLASAQYYIDSILYRISDCGYSGATLDTKEKLKAISSFAQGQNLTVQLVTTQRQVVVVLTYVPEGITIGAYYDMVLEQYSGLVINARQ